MRKDPAKNREKIVHSTHGIELIRSLVTDGRRIFRLEDAAKLAPEVGLSKGYLRQALHYLAKDDWITRLRKGLYAINPAVQGAVPAHRFEVAMHLVKIKRKASKRSIVLHPVSTIPEPPIKRKDTLVKQVGAPKASQAPVAISHWSAMHFHGLTEQGPRLVFVTTTTDVSMPRDRSQPSTKRGKHRRLTVGGTEYRIVQVKPERFFGTKKVWIGDARVVVTDPERTLLDGLSMPEHNGTFAGVLNAFDAYADRLNVKRIVSYALKLDHSICQRLGWVLHRRLKLSKSAWSPLLKQCRGYRYLDPNGGTSRAVDPQWRLHLNSLD